MVSEAQIKELEQYVDQHPNNTSELTLAFLKSLTKYQNYEDLTEFLLFTHACYIVALLHVVKQIDQEKTLKKSKVILLDGLDISLDDIAVKMH